MQKRQISPCSRTPLTDQINLLQNALINHYYLVKAGLVNNILKNGVSRLDNPSGESEQFTEGSYVQSWDVRWRYKLLIIKRCFRPNRTIILTDMI